MVRLGTAAARVQATGDLLVGFLGLWCRVVTELIGGFHKLVVGAIADVGFKYAAEVDWHCIGGVAVRTEALAYIPAGKGSRWCTGAPQALLALYLYAAFWLRHVELRLACE
jgi:hypothetical protein